MDFGRLREGMNGVFNAVVRLPPGMGQLASVMGSMALGSALTVGIMAGLAAIGYAFGKLTEKARELKKATEEAHTAAARFRDPLGTVALVGLQAAAGSTLTEVQAKIRKHQETIERNAFTSAAAAAQGELVGLRQKETELLRTIGSLSDQIQQANRKSREETEKKNESIAKSAESAAKEALALQHAANQASLVSRNLQNAAAALAEMKRQGFNFTATGVTAPGIGFIRPTVRTIGSITHSDRVPLQMDPRLRLPASSILRTGSATAGGPQAGGFFSGLGDSLGSMFNPASIGAGLATGGASILLGAFTTRLGTAVSGLLGLSNAAKELREALKHAREEFARSNAEELARRRATTEAERAAIDRAADIRARYEDFNRLYSSGPPVRIGTSSRGQPVYGGSDTAMPGGLSEAAMIAWINNQLETNKYLDAAERVELTRIRDLAIEAQKTADAFRSMREAMVNVPEGFKSALRMFQSTDAAGRAWAAEKGPDVTPGKTGATFNNAVIHVHGVEDPKQFLEKIEKEVVNKQLTGGTTLKLGYSS